MHKHQIQLQILSNTNVFDAVSDEQMNNRFDVISHKKNTTNTTDLYWSFVFLLTIT